MERVADFIAGFLSEIGAGFTFLVSGGFAMHLNDALAANPAAKYICNHHEQASAMAADGFARQSGKIGVAMATGGPGATNLVTGIAEAWVDSIPILFLTGTNARAQTARCSGIEGLRQLGFLELDILPVVDSITKYAVSVQDPSRIRFHLEKALYLATTGRPGPVLIEVPLDVQGTSVDVDTLPGFLPPDIERNSNKLAAQCVKTADLLRRAERPLILAGHGIRCGNAVDLFRRVVHKLEIPVVTTQMAKDLLPYEDSLFIGHPGLRGDRAGNFAIQNCDLLISLGSSLHSQTTGYDSLRFAPKAERIQVDPDGPLLSRANGAGLRVQAECGPFLAALDAELDARGAIARPEKWRQECVTAKYFYRSQHEPHCIEAAEDPSSLYELIWELNRQSTPNTTFLTDSGQSKMIAGQALQLKEGQRYLANGGLGGMGWALPAAIGAASADSKRQVVAIIGDGSLQTNVHELQTLSHHKLNVKLFIIQNGGYASIRATQRQYFNGRLVGADASSGVSLPDSAALAAAYGMAHVNCPSRATLVSQVALALCRTGPVICSVEVQRDQKIIPYVASRKLPDGSMATDSLDIMLPLWSPPTQTPLEVAAVEQPGGIVSGSGVDARIQ